MSYLVCPNILVPLKAAGSDTLKHNNLQKAWHSIKDVTESSFLNQEQPTTTNLTHTS